MKYLILGAILVCLRIISVAQSLEEKISDGLCDCFKTLDQSLNGNNVLAKYQEDCFMQTLRQFESEINGIPDTIQGGTDYERGQKLGRLINTQIEVTMIDKCDAFFYFMVEFRNEVFKTVNKEEELLNIKKKTKEIRDKQKPSDYYVRAVSYFALREFKLAMKDLDKAIRLDKNYAPPYLLRGFLFELTRKFPKAVADYEVSKKLMTRGDIDIYIAMARRKARELR
jgi:tetratricopeptide (TPR) repeat protein